MANHDSTHGKIKSVHTGLSTITQHELKMIANFRQINDYGQDHLYLRDAGISER